MPGPHRGESARRGPQRIDVDAFIDCSGDWPAEFLTHPYPGRERPAPSVRLSVAAATVPAMAVQGGLHLHRAERADALVEALAAVLRDPPDDPLAPEVIAVPARGVERWLTQRLSHHLGDSRGAAAGDGVCANVRFPAPARLVADAVAAASGHDPGGDPDGDPWAPGRVVWFVLEVIDTCAGEPWCAALARHLHGHTTSRRMVAAGHLASLFTSYAEQRPTVLRDWARGDDTDGDGAALPCDLRWQAELWRRLRARIGVESPAEGLTAACAALRQDECRLDLPERLSLFGPTRLTRGQVAVLAAVAAHRDVHLWLPHPSAALWDRVAALAPPGAPRRRDDPSASVPRHRLLASLGRDAREMQLLLAGCGGVTSDQNHPPASPPATLLGRLQHDLRTDTAPPGPPVGDAPDTRLALDPADQSLQVHACHGRARQVEVLREVLLGLLEADPTLEPRHVLVMCPDIESYAPLVSATFGLADSDLSSIHPGHRLRVRLADRSLRQTNPLLATLARLLDLADGRVTAAQVLDLAAMAPVSRRFSFGGDDLGRLRDWVSTSGVRWGLDAAHRAPFAMQRVGQNTWQAGLDRVLLGAAMSEDDLAWVGLGLPLDDVDSTDIDLAGRLAELVDRLGATLDRLSSAQPLSAWLDALSEALDALTWAGEADAWQLAQARRELAEVAEGAGAAGTAVLSLGDVRALLGDRLAGRPTRANFRTGNLTMCSMVPMRSVPHRVICLLGLDDGVFPRTAGIDGDDVLARDPVVGERDRRSEDRQLLLDAALAAQEHLVVLYTGADERTNTVRPPAVPLGEILDVVDATVRAPDGQPARDRVVVHHPLQPFDARNFRRGVLGADGPFSFDRAGLAGAVAAAHPRQPARRFLSAPLPASQETGTVALDALIRFLEHPVRGFLRQRLGVAAPDEADELDDALHAELRGLDEWGVGNRWLRERIAGADPGADPGACRQAEWRRGTLPPGALGHHLLDEVEVKAEPLVTVARTDQVGPARTMDVLVPLPEGRVLSGTVGPVHGHTISRVEYGTLKPKHRLKAWVQLLALAAARPEEPWRAATVGRGKALLLRSVLTDPPTGAATDLLAALVEVYDAGLREPLPLPLAAAADYADRRRSGATQQIATDGARKAWRAAFEHTDRDHVVVWGEEHGFDAVLEQLPAATEQGEVLDEPEATRFGALACRVWLPLLDVEILAKP